ncbi:hypothetical protein HMPREF0673_01812 [Leyella stercorea DSM 18206]|uniref:Uncharacterized protein n=1 Tax=Leyella stercorea DSM 18206 TaxID=1002367 RepID=G6AYV1_9BACT|nr:hypothetical protein HMPREF0673_01812 [Leyella stercorea DSM 18206]
MQSYEYYLIESACFNDFAPNMKISIRFILISRLLIRYLPMDINIKL